MPTLQIPSTDGVTVAFHDLGGDGPPLLLCHATGLHGRVWEPIAAELGAVARCWALDFRGHGDSSAPVSGSFDWSGMADDVLAVVDHLRTQVDGGDGPSHPLRAVGHSMGGAALFLAEEASPGTFRGLWCYEPIVIPPVEGAPRANPLAAQARRRRPWFPSREAALANYAAKPPMATFDPAALVAYVEHGFRDLGDGTVELKCTPEIEARVFDAAMANQAFAHLGEMACPVTVAASGDGAPPALMAPLVVDAVPDGRLLRIPELSHFGPLEDPVTVAAAIRTAFFSS